MKAKSLYIQKLAYDENTGNEIIGLFPSEANPAIVSSYTYDAKRMGGAPTLTATIYSSEPLQWKKEEFVEYNGDRFFASYTPNSTKDNSSRMWKSEITFTSRRELLDNTLFFDVVVDDVDTQNKDRYRSNQTKFTFGGTIHEFVARVNSSMAYCGLYRPTDEYKGYYVVVDEGYGTDEVKEVSFEDQYLTDVLQLINTTFELDYYWDGSVCHVGKVQHDLTDTPIKYGSSDALISVSKENANYKIVDMITGYGSSDNLPYYYPNDNEFGDAAFETENFSKLLVTNIDLSKVWKWNPNIYNDILTLCNTSKFEYKANIIGASPYLAKIRGGLQSDNMTQYPSSYPKLQNSIDGVKFTSHLGRVSYSYDPGFGGSATTTSKKWHFEAYIIAEIEGMPVGGSIDFSKFAFTAKEVGTNLGFKFSYTYKYYVGEDMTKEDVAKILNNTNLSISGFGIKPEGMTDYSDSSDKIAPIVGNAKHAILVECSILVSNTGVIGDKNVNAEVVAEPSGAVNYVFKPKSQYYWQYGTNTKEYDECGIEINNLTTIPTKILEFSFDGNKWNGIEGDDANASKIHITNRVWIAPSSVLMPSIYRNTKGAERFYYALNNTHKLPSGNGYYEFVNLYKKGNPHQGTVTFDDIKPTISGIVNAEGQLFGEIADVAFDKEDSDVKDSDGKYIHSYFYIKLHKFNGDFGFDLFAHALASEPAKINLIKSNGCPACSFVIYNQPSADNSKCYNCVSVDENGNLKPVRTDKNDYIFANASDAYEDKLNQDSTQKELWIAVQKDTSTLGIIMPNASAGFKPQKGDLFVITGIKPPKVLVTAAEKRLDDALIKHMSENNTDQFNYSVKFSRIFLQENPDFASKLNENAKLSIQIQGDSDSDGNLISHEVFVSNYSVKVDNDELAEVEIELVNSLEVTKSDTKQIIDAVKGEAVKSLSSMVSGSNTNSFNASITDKMYLSKLNDDTAKGTVTWEKMQKFLQGLTAEDLSQFKKGATFGEFIQGMLFGTGGRIDELGNAEFESITSRSSIIAKELIVNRQTAMESNFVFTESGMVETVTEIPAATEGGNVTFDLKLQKRWDNDFTAFKENDVILASINTLTENGKYYDMWLRVLSVNTVTNTITVVCYPDDECPSKKNYPPCELARLIRWGNAVDEDRQSCWYISSSEGLLVWLDHVTKPIIDKTNYSLAMGKLPDALSFLFQDFPTANKRDGAFYAKWMMAASFQQIDYQGNPIYTTRDRGVWSLSVAQGDNPYRNGEGTIDTVYYLGCKWKCLEDKTTKPPVYSSTAWAFVEGNPYFTLEMQSSKLWNFRLNDLMATNADGSWKVFTTLSVVGRLYNQDVTDSMVNVVWTRDSGNPTADNKWALSHANCGLSVDLTYEDLGGAAFKIGSVTFRCDTEIKDGETMYSEDVSVSF